MVLYLLVVAGGVVVFGEGVEGSVCIATLIMGYAQAAITAKWRGCFLTRASIFSGGAGTVCAEVVPATSQASQPRHDQRIAHAFVPYPKTP